MYETFLQDHAGDKREHVYTQEELEQARTHDDLWNAAQVRYYRVLLIKHIMELVSTKDQIHYAICDCNMWILYSVAQGSDGQGRQDARLPENVLGQEDSGMDRLS